MKFPLKHFILIVLCFASAVVLNAQNVSFNAEGSAPDPSAMLDVSDTTRGILVPRMTFSQRNLVLSPAQGLLIFQTNLDSGFYYNRGSKATPNWTRLKTDGDSSFWSKKDTNLYYNSGNVGIGIDSAQGLLHLYGKGSLGAGARMVFGDDYHNQNSKGLNTFIGEFGWDSLIDSDRLQLHGKQGQIFTTGGSNGRQDMDTSMFINSTGLGIKTTIPRMELHVNGSIIAESSSLTGLPTGITYAILTNNNDESLLSSSSGFKSELLKINGSTIRFSSGVSNFSNPTVMFIDTIGNVGIGTDTPENQLDIIDTGIVGLRIGADQIDQFLKLDYNTAFGFSSIQSGLFGVAPRPLILQGGGGNVGVGTTTPTGNFQVDLDLGKFFLQDNLAGAGPIAGTTLLGELRGTALSPQFRYSNTNSGNFFDIGLDVNENFVIEPNDERLFTFRKEGWLNIGYDTTGFKLFIGDKTGGNLFTRMSSTSGQVGFWVSNDSIGWAMFSDRTAGATLLQPGAVGLFLTNGSGLAWTVTKEGKMGIGTPNTPALELSIGPADDDTGFETNSDGNLSLFTNGVERVRFDENGNVGIGTTNPAQKLDVNGGAEINYLGINGAALSNVPLRIVARSNNLAMRFDQNDGTAKWDIFTDANSLNFCESNVACNRLVLETGGNIGIGRIPSFKLDVNGSIRANATVYASDRRLKTDIKEIKNVLSSLDQITGVYHYWDTLNFADRNYSSKQALGVIAQDIQKVYPQLVLEDNEGYLSVDYSKFTAVLLQAIKEQQVLIEQQNQNNEKQQDQIEFLMEELKAIKEEIKK